MVEAPELLDVLARRHALLRAISETPRERHELVDAVDDAKSTVYKGVSQLEELGLVEGTADGLRATLFGVVVLRQYEELARTAALGPRLAGLPPEAIDPVVFVGSEFVSPDVGAVGRHLEHAQELLASAGTVRGVVPIASTDNVGLIRTQVADGEMDAEFVISDELADSFGDATVQSLLDDGLTLHRTSRPVPFGVFVISGDPVRMAVEFRDGTLVTGLLLNDTAESIAWARTVIADYKAEAEPLEG